MKTASTLDLRGLGAPLPPLDLPIKASSVSVEPLDGGSNSDHGRPLVSAIRRRGSGSTDRSAWLR